MKKLIITIEPFILNQKIDIYTDDDKETFIISRTHTLVIDIFNFINSINTKEERLPKIIIVGPNKEYSKNLYQKLKEKELQDYSENKLEIEVY